MFFTMRERNEYFKGVLNQILDSYSIIENLSDESADLNILQIEMSKIMGFFTIIFRKINVMSDKSNEFSKLEKNIGQYLSNYDFSREINLLIKTFSDDKSRIKNIRITVLNSLNDKQLIDYIHSFSKEL